MKKSPLFAATLVALVGIVAVARFAVAGSSFLGQGTVPFDRIKVGRNDADKIELNGTILNSRKDKPVYVGDSLKVKGDVSIAGNLTFPNDQKGWISAPGTDNWVGINDDAMITGALSVDGATTLKALEVTGALTAGPYNVGQVIVDSAALSGRLGKFTDCVATLAQFTTYVTSSDYIFCFNTWIAPSPITVLSHSTLSPTQRGQLEERRQFDLRDPVEALHELAHPAT